VTISPEDTLQVVVDLLTERRIGAAIVMEGADIVGIVSERNTMRRAEEHGTEVLACKVRDAMTRDVRLYGESDRIEEIMTHITEGANTVLARDAIHDLLLRS
jgi:CBS domain-containing protein